MPAANENELFELVDHFSPELIILDFVADGFYSRDHCEAQSQRARSHFGVDRRPAW